MLTNEGLAMLAPTTQLTDRYLHTSAHTVYKQTYCTVNGRLNDGVPSVHNRQGVCLQQELFSKR